MHNAGVREVSSNVLEVSQGAKREMVDDEGVVEAEALLPQEHDDIAKRVVANVEIAGDANCFDEALEAASLTFFELLLNSVRNLLTVLVLLLPG